MNPDQAVNMKNLRIGRLKVIKRAPNGPQGEARWVCRCDCGRVETRNGGNLRRPGAATTACVRCRGRNGGRRRAAIAREPKPRAKPKPRVCPGRDARKYPLSFDGDYPLCRPCSRATDGCRLCGDMSWRVTGKQCRHCGLAYAPERVPDIVEYLEMPTERRRGT